MDPALWESLRAEAGTAGDRVLEAIIRLARPGIEIPGVQIVSRFGTIATCRIPARDVIAVWARPYVLSLKAARGLSPGFELAVGPPDRASPAQLSSSATDVRRSPALGLTGTGVVVAAIDWGVDVDSAAFRWPDDPMAIGRGHRAGSTRFLSFWDQRDQAVGPRPDPYGYGSVHNREEIDRALQDPRPYEQLGYHPAIADPQRRGAHGTRTIDIAAGNGRAGGPVGIAPDADLIFVHLADRNTGGLANFGDSVRLLEAVDFISRTAGPQPCVINISAGRICGPKDGTTLVERAFDELLAATPGRFVVNSAGNYHGWRAHSCGTIAPGETRSLTFVSDPADITINELEIWYDGADEFAVRIEPPGYTAGRPVCLGERSDLLIGGRVVGRVYHRECDPNNGDNHIVAYLDPVGRAGNWTVTLEARRVSSGRFHAWIERDDSCPGCQARFTHDDSNPATTIGSIATSHLPLIVGAYNGHDPARPAATFSSAGPCRDGRCKPDLGAPGVGVLAARSAPIGASRNPGLLVRGNGTSFATPHVTGAVALCFEAAGNRLSAHEIRSLVLGSCDPVPDTDPQCRLGHGYLNIPRLTADVQQALAAPATAASAKEPTMDTEDTIMLLGAAPAIAYREYLYRPHGQLARRIGHRFDIVARPGQRVDRAPQRGDLLIEVVLGRMRGGRYVILDGPELEIMGSRPRLPQGQLILRPLPRAEMSEPMSVEPASEDEDAGLDRLIDQGLSENQITDALFYARHPGQSGATLQANTRAAREWQGIRDTQVRPGVRQRLELSPADPVQLAVFLSQYENDSRVPAEYTRRFLTGTPLLSMGRTLRERVIGNWRNGGRPLTALGLFELALETAGDPATAELLCHNVTKAFAREGAAITWRGTGTEGEYTDGQRTYTAKVINSAGRLKYYHGGRQREVISIFYLLISAKEFGTDDPGDWYHYFVTATMTALASGGTLGPTTGRGRREDVEGDEEERGGRAGTAMYRGLLSDRVADLEKQMTDPALASVPGYRGWVLANVLSFLEGGHYGADYATGQSDVVRESQVHLRGAAFGLHTMGGSPGKTWRWYVPVAGRLSDADLAMGFSLRDKTATVWGPNAKPAAGEAADMTFDEDHDSSAEDEDGAERHQTEERLGVSEHRGVGESSDVEGQVGAEERYDPEELSGEGLSGYERYGVDELYGADQHQGELSDDEQSPTGFEETLPSGWQNAVGRAIFGGERRINALVKIGRDAGGPTAQAVRTEVMNLLRLPFPHPAQIGSIPCEQHARIHALAHPDLPPTSPHLRIFTGRYESVSTDGKRYFWAINQAGTAVIAIRTKRDWASNSKDYWMLRGDLQADGTVVLFQADKPEAFWGYLQEQPDRRIRWHDGSYLGPDGNRRIVDGTADRDEVLELTVNNRPTLMESLWHSPDRRLSVLLQQSEWFPLSPEQLRFIESSVSSDLLRDLIGDYLATTTLPGITYSEKEAQGRALGRLVNYIANMLWDGAPATRPEFVLKGQATLPHGHHNNALLAAHVAKIWLAHFKLNSGGYKRSYLDWLTEFIQHQKLESLSKMLDIPIDAARAKGTYQYRLTLEVISAGIVYAEGTLRVEKLTAPRWPGKGTLSYNFGALALGKPRLPSRDQVFDLVVTTPQEWGPDDFEGTLWLFTVTASAGASPAKAGAKITGGFLNSNSGMSIALEDGDVFLETGIPRGMKDKPKITLAAEGMRGPVSRSGTGRLDLSRPFVASAPVIGNLTAATHFCFGSSLLTPAARQLLRFVCADQLAALDSEASQIIIVGHTDRPDTDLRNDELSRLRAENVRTTLHDILGPALKVKPDMVLCLGFGEWMARLKLRPERLRNPADRRVDILLNATLVASLKGD